MGLLFVVTGIFFLLEGFRLGLRLFCAHGHSTKSNILLGLLGLCCLWVFGIFTAVVGIMSFLKMLP